MVTPLKVTGTYQRSELRLSLDRGEESEGEEKETSPQGAGGHQAADPGQGLPLLPPAVQ